MPDVMIAPKWKFHSFLMFVVTEPGTGFESKGLALRVQKKLASKMSSKAVAKVFIDELTGQLLDNVYQLVKEYTSDKKEAEKIVKYLIKITIKVAIAFRNDQLNADELRHVEEFKRKFRTTVMTITSFVDVDFTFDKNFLSGALLENRDILHKITDRHTTDKTKGKLDKAFALLSDPQFLEAVFTPDSKYSPIMVRISQQLDQLMESGTI